MSNGQPVSNATVDQNPTDSGTTGTGCELAMLWLLLTYRCTARCAHCLVDGRPEQTAWMSLATAEQYLATVAADHPLQYLGIVGGEALLDLDLCVGIGELAKAHGLPKVVISGTNCCWATTDSRAREVLTRLTTAGISVELSMDGFHDGSVPFDRVVRALRVAGELGLERKVETNLVEGLAAMNPYDTRTRELVKRLTAEQLVPGGPDGDAWTIKQIGFYGRAARLSSLVSGARSIPLDRCAGAPWLSPDFRQPSSIIIDPDGWVMPEFGIAIGNTRQSSLASILASYRAEDHPIIRVLLQQGPIGLTRMPEAAGFALRSEGYLDKCHLCYEIRDYLQPHFPGILAPRSCYPGGTES